LHPAIAKKIEDKNDYLKTSHLELLSRLKSKHDQLELSNIVERNHFSVRTLEKMISGSQPFRETVEESGGSLYVRLPHEIVEETKIEAGDLVYLYPETRRRIAIEPATLKPHPIARTSELASASYVE
jgi:antitoxin component of MazEF toxin-antitoxin module